jgi:hypothetical protein
MLRDRSVRAGRRRRDRWSWEGFQIASVEFWARDRRAAT